MRRIVATVAFGPEAYYDLARVMFLSLDAVGSEAERVIVCDREWAAAPPGVRSVVVPPSLQMKPAAAGVLGLGMGDSLMLVDTDMIFVRNPDFLFEGEGVRVATTGMPLRLFKFCNQYLSENEILRIPMDRRCLNTGLVVVEGALAAELSSTWADAHRLLRGEAPPEGFITICDQPALEALAWRGQVRVEQLPSSYMHFPAGTDRARFPDCVVLHFTGYPRSQGGKSRIEQAMRAAMAKEFPHFTI